MRIRPPLLYILVIGLLSLVGGCAGPPAGGPGNGLEPSLDPCERDIPLAAGFVLADQSSEDWASRPVRYLRHRDIGPADPHGVRRFYRRQMPLVTWTSISEGSVGGRMTMRFEREAESCTITTERETLWATVEVVIAPKAR